MFRKVMLMLLFVLPCMLNNVYGYNSMSQNKPDYSRPDVIWDYGAGSDFWTIGNNWTADRVPTEDDEVFIDFIPGHTSSTDHSCDVLIGPYQRASCYTLFGPGFNPYIGAHSSLTLDSGILDIGGKWLPAHNDIADEGTEGFEWPTTPYWKDVYTDANVVLTGDAILRVMGQVKQGDGLEGRGKNPSVWFNKKLNLNISGNSYAYFGGGLTSRRGYMKVTLSGNSVVDCMGEFRFADYGKADVYITENAVLNCSGLIRGAGNENASVPSVFNFYIEGGTVNVTNGIKIGEDGTGIIKITGGVINSKGPAILSCRSNLAGLRDIIQMEGGEAHFGGLSMNENTSSTNRQAVLIMKGGMLEISSGNFAFPENKGPNPAITNAKMYFSGGNIKAGGSKWDCPDPNQIVIDVNDTNGGGMFSVGGDANAFIDMSYAQGQGKLNYTVNNTDDNIFRFKYMPVDGNEAGVTYLGVINKKKAWGPLPYDGQKSVTSSVYLQWNPGDSVTGQKLYTGTNKAALQLVKTLGAADTNDTLTGINPWIANYWRIDSITSGGTVTGDIWEFGSKPTPATNPNPANPGTQTDLLTGKVSWTKSVFPGLVGQDVYLGTAPDTLVKIGEADDVAQSETFTPANVETGDTFQLTATAMDGSGSTVVISFTATAATVANVTAGLSAAWNASTDPLCTPVTAVNNSTSLTLKADAAGVSFSVTSSTTNGGAVNNQSLAKTSNVTHTFNTGPLVPDTTYYWRIDSYFNLFPSVPVTGNVWKFTTIGYFFDFEGFETYTDYTSWHDTWKDGDTDFTSGAYINLNDTGTPVRSGSKSAVMTLWTDGMPKAIVSRPVPLEAKDWASKGFAVLTLWFYGNPNNAYPNCYSNPGDVSKLYIAIDNDADPSNATKQYYDGDDTDMFVSGWHEWNVALSGFTGINLSNVQSLGIGADILPKTYGPSIVIDDIRLYPARCLPLRSGLTADLTSDCIVDSDDLRLMSYSWLKASPVADIYPAVPDNMVNLKDYVILSQEWLGEGLFH